VVSSVVTIRERKEEPETPEGNVIEATLAHDRSITPATPSGWQTILGPRLSVVPSVVIIGERKEERGLPEENVFEATLARSRSSARATTEGRQTILGSGPARL